MGDPKSIYFHYSLHEDPTFSMIHTGSSYLLYWGSLFSLDPKNGSTRTRLLTYVRVYVLMNNIILLCYWGVAHRDRWTVRMGGAGGLGDGLPMVSR